MRAVLWIARIVMYAAYVEVLFEVSAFGIAQKVILSIVTLLIAEIMNSFIHESGHLIGGLGSGYHLLLFRVHMYRVENRRGRVRGRFAAGFGCQCVMIPGEKTKTYHGYLMGGILFNFVVSFAAALATLRMESRGVLHYVLFAIAVNGVCNLLSNGIPVFVRKKPYNDMAMVWILQKNRQTEQEYYLYLRCFEKAVLGESIGRVIRPETEPGGKYCDYFWQEIQKLLAEEDALKERECERSVLS